MVHDEPTIALPTPTPVPRRTNLLRRVAAVQGAYFVLTGIWPLFGINSFQAVTGAKTDLWLVYTVGCLVAWLAARVVACRVQLVDVNPRRADVARLLGVPFASPETAEAGADVVIHASGAPDGLERALRLAGVEATIVELSWYGDRPVSLPLGGAFHANRLTIAASQVGRIAPSQRARWDTRRRMHLVLDLLGDPSLDALLTGESGFEALPETMSALARSAGDTLCHVVRYGDV